jgi:cobalt-zinc-cadmium resistance protein CzcA
MLALLDDEFGDFGRLIILIVFIPILSLSGIEGKMFKPVA